MHPLLLALLFFALANALVSNACARRYRLGIKQRDEWEAAPGHHWDKWRIPKDRQDASYWEAFWNIYIFLWVCTLIIVFVTVVAKSVMSG